MKKKTDWNTEVSKYWKQANEFAKQGNIEKADEAIDYGLVVCGLATLRGETQLAGTNLNLWKDRFWILCENLGLLPD